MTQFTNRRPTNRPPLTMPSQWPDPPISELGEWWQSVKTTQVEKFVAIDNTTQYLGVQVTNEVTARISADEVLATEIDSLVVSISAKSKITVSGSAPAGPATNDLWLDTSDQNKYKFWDGVAWQYKQDLVLAASVTTEASARVTADGFLSGKYTLTVAAGNVVTGMNITSSSGSGTNISDVTFVAANFKIYNGTTGITMFEVAGSTVNLAGTLTVSTSGKVFIGTGTYGNTNTAFYVDSSGQFSLKDSLTWNGTTLSINGVITSTSGTIGGFTLGASSLTGGSGVTQVIINTTGSVGVGMVMGNYAASETTIQFDRTGYFVFEGNDVIAELRTTGSAGSRGGFLELWDTTGFPTFIANGALGTLNVNTYIDTNGHYRVDGTQVVTNQQAAEANIALNTSVTGSDTVSESVISQNFDDLNTKINSLLAKLRTHGLIAT